MGIVSTVASRSLEPSATETQYVWDPVVRMFHWLLVGAFAIAYVTEDDVLLLHVWAGYLIGVLIVLRLIWGIVGPRHARFADFVWRPRAVAAYLGDLLMFKARRHLGHSPAGGAMVFLLLVSLSLTVISGLAVYGAEKGAGPLAGLFAASRAERPTAELTSPRIRDDRDQRRRRDDERAKNGADLLEALHEFCANLTLILVLIHVGGVLVASFAHRENLTRAMITGYKRPLGQD